MTQDNKDEEKPHDVAGSGEGVGAVGNVVKPPRRVRYRGRNPRRFEEKYKELEPDLDPSTVARVIASGKTPAGQHRPIMVKEVVEVLRPAPGDRAVDVTLGYGGHALALLEAIVPGGHLLGLDADPVEKAKTELRLRGLGYGENAFSTSLGNFAGLAKVLQRREWADGADVILADLGVSSMQIDNPRRGFSYKLDGPLDMRMNPGRGVSAAGWLAGCEQGQLVRALQEGGDEPRSEDIASSVLRAATKGKLATTLQLRAAVESALPTRLDQEARDRTVARVFQAIRIAVNDEFSALDSFLAALPYCLRPGGRVAIISFHSGEDRRVKHHFRDGFRGGVYAEMAPDIIRATPEEVRSNPRSSSAKLRWAVKA